MKESELKIGGGGHRAQINVVRTVGHVVLLFGGVIKQHMREEEQTQKKIER